MSSQVGFHSRGFAIAFLLVFSSWLRSAEITIQNDDDPGIGFNDPTPVSPVGGNTGITLGQQRLNAVQWAADIWAGQLDSDVVIEVEASFSNLDCTQSEAILASAIPTSYSTDFSGAPFSLTWYPLALANAISGVDQSTNLSDIVLTINLAIGSGCFQGAEWYYGFDGQAGQKIDLVTVVLHELAHGLGLTTTADLVTGSWKMGRKDIYSFFLEDHSIGKLWPDMNALERITSAIDSGDLHWTGPQAMAAANGIYGGVHPSGHLEMYAPNPLQETSVNHLSNAFSPNQLLEPDYAGANHQTGLATQMLFDMGWQPAQDADLELGLSTASAQVEAGVPFTATLNLVNQGPGRASAMLIQLGLSSNLQLISTTGSGQFDEDQLTWIPDALNGSETANLVLTLQATHSGFPVLQAELMQCGPNDPDSTPGNGINSEDDSLEQEWISSETLSNGDLKTQLVAAQDGWLIFKMDVPASQSRLNFTSFGGWGDVDLFARRNAPPDLDHFDADSRTPGNHETISIDAPEGGTWFVGAYGFLGFEDVNLTGHFNADDLVLAVNRTLRANCPQMTIDLNLLENGVAVTGANSFTINEDGLGPVPPTSIVELSSGHYQLSYTTQILHGGDVFPVVEASWNGKNAFGYGLFNNCTPEGSYIQTWMDTSYQIHAGQNILVPVQVEAIEQGFHVNAFEMTITYDASVLDYSTLTTDNSLTQDWDLVYSNGSTPGRILISAASTQQIELNTQNPGILLGLNFTVKPEAVCGSCSDLIFENVTFNNGSPGSVTEPGRICVPCGGGGTPMADLELERTITPSSALPGEAIEFTLRVKNNGPNSTSNVTVREQFAAGCQYDSSTGDGSYDPTNGIWTIGTMYPQTEAHIVLRTIATSPGHYGKTAEIRTSSAFDPDSTPNNNIATEDDIAIDDFFVLSPGSADLSLSKSVDVPNPKLGDSVTFTLTLENGGPDTATGIQVIDRYLEMSPPALVLVKDSFTGDGSFDSANGLWFPPDLTSGNTASANLTFSVASLGTVKNTAEVYITRQDDPDSTPNNRSASEDDLATASCTVQSADLSVSVSCGDLTPLLEDPVAINVSITNSGPDPANAETLISLPAGIQYISDTSGGSYQPESGYWIPSTLNSGDTQQFTIQGIIKTTFRQAISVEVTDSDQGDPDSIPNNHVNSEDDYDAIVLTPQIADLELEMETDNPAPGIGESVTITLTLTNKGPHLATQVLTTTIIDGPLSLVSSSDGNFDEGSGIWNVGDVDTTAPRILELVFTKDSAGTSEITAEVTQSDPYDPDSTPGNGIVGEDDDAHLRLGLADLSLQSTVTDSAPPLGGIVTISLTLTNSGPDPVSEVLISLNHTNEFIFQGPTGNGSYNHEDKTWSLQQIIQPGESASINLDYKVYGFMPKTLSAEVVFSDLPDPDSTTGNQNPSEDDFTSQTLIPECGSGASILVVNADAPGEGFNDPTPINPVGGNSGTTIGEQRLIAFQYAADIWASFLSSAVTIIVEAQFDPLTCNSSSAVLGAAGPVSVARDFPGAPVSQTWYPIALANSLAGSDIHIDSADVSATFNSSIDQNDGCLSGVNWYYGLDRNAGSNMDFVSVLLHEMGHGLGFLTLVNGTSGAKFLDLNDIYMIYLESHQLQKNWSNMTNQERASSAVQTGDLHWVGSELTSNSGDLTTGTSVEGHVEMFSPNPYQQGSSVSHFSTNLAPNELMEPYYTGPNHNPGHALDLLLDIGWGCQQENKQTADLELALVPETDQPILDEELVIQLQLLNKGPDAASNLSVQFELPSELSFVSSSGTGTYDSGSGIWTLPGLQVNQTSTMDVTVTVDRSYGIPISAELMTSDQADPDSTPGNGAPDEDDYDQSDLAPRLEDIADLSLGGTLSTTTPQPGDDITLILSLHNRGIRSAMGPTIHVELPSGCHLVNAEPGFDSGSGLWSPGQTDPDSNKELLLTLNIETSGNHVLRAQVQSSDLPDPDSTPGNGYVGEDDEWTGNAYGQPNVPDCADCANIVLDVQDSDGEGFLDPTPVEPVGGNSGTTLGDQRIIAFQHAAQLFCNLLKSSEPIVASVAFDSLTCNETSAILGAASPQFAVRDFTGAPMPSTWFPGALANSLANGDFNTGGPEISAVFNSQIDVPETISEPGPCTSSSINYQVENVNSHKIKFENAAIGLGENQTYMKDAFVIQVEGAGNNVLVEMKAATTKAQMLVGEGDTVLFGTLGFKITLVSIEGPEYTFEVESTCNPHALSHISFDFGAGNIIQPSTSTYSAPRSECENGWSQDCSPPINSESCLFGVHWYYGLDGKPSGNQLDFVTVVLHELTHGMGFTTFVDLNYDNGKNALFGSKLLGFDDAYMRNLEDHSTGLHWNEMSQSERAFSATDPEDLHWTGPQVMEQAYYLSSGTHTSGHVPMFSPQVLQPGSSVTHWSTSLSPDELMEPYYTEGTHQLGLAGPALWDIGWQRAGCIDLELFMDVDNQTPSVGDYVTFSLDLINQGDSDANQVIAQSQIGPGLVFQSYSGDGTFDNATGFWEVGTLPAGQFASIELTYQVQNGKKSQTVEVYSVNEPDEDSIPNNQNPAEDDFQKLTLGLADLSMVVSTNQPSYVSPEEFEISVSVTNSGPDDAWGVLAHLDIPSKFRITHEDSGGFFNPNTHVWDIDQIPYNTTRTLVLTGYVKLEGSLDVKAEVIYSDLLDPDSTPGNGFVGEDDEDSLTVDILNQLGTLNIQIGCLAEVNCPTMQMTVGIDRDGAPQTGLLPSQFQISIDSVATGFTMSEGQQPGTYFIEFDMIDPDGEEHNVNLSLNDQGDHVEDTQSFTACDASGYSTLSPQVTVNHLSGLAEHWRYYRVEIPANQTQFEVRSFFGTGDCDVYLKQGNQPTLQSYDAKSTQSGNQESIILSYPAGGVWYIGIYGYQDYCDTSMRVEWTQADLGMTIQTVFTDSCPLVKVEVQVSRDQMPVTWLQASDFRIFEDGTQMTVESAVQGPTGVYRIGFTSPRADSQPHDLEINVNLSGHWLSEGISYADCSGSCQALNNNQVDGPISGISGSWRCFYIDVPPNQDILETFIFGGNGDADIYIKYGSPASPSDFDAFSNHAGNDDYLAIDHPASGRWYIGLRGVGTYRDTNLLARYYVRDLSLNIKETSIASCPDILLRAEVFTNEIPVTTLGIGDFSLQEGDQPPQAFDHVANLDNGVYELSYRTLRTQGQDTQLSVTVQYDSKQAWDNTSFTNCTRRGGALDVWVNDEHAAPAGATVMIPIHIDPVLAGFFVESFEFELDYDPGILTYLTTKKQGSLSASWPYIDDSDTTPGAVRIQASSMGNGFIESSQEGYLLFLEFEVNPFASIGECTPLTLVQDAFRFNDGVPAAQTSDGRFCVSSGCFAAVGDVDQDGNAKEAWDALQIIREITGIPTIYDPIPICVADTNCSGTVTLFDAMLILQRSVNWIQSYCSSGKNKSVSGFNLHVPETVVAPGEPFELNIILDQLPSDPAFGFSFDLSYDSNSLNFSVITNPTGSLTERWAPPVASLSENQVTLTQYNPYSPIETPGTLLHLVGTAGFIPGTYSISFPRFQMASNSEPEMSFGPFTIRVEGTTCFDLAQYENELQQWHVDQGAPSPVTILDLLDRISCLASSP